MDPITGEQEHIAHLQVAAAVVHIQAGIAAHHPRKHLTVVTDDTAVVTGQAFQSLITQPPDAGIPHLKQMRRA